MLVTFAAVALIAFGGSESAGALPRHKKGQIRTSLYGGGFGSKKKAINLLCRNFRALSRRYDTSQKRGTDYASMITNARRSIIYIVA